MSADDATRPTTDSTDGDRPPFEDHDFGGDAEQHATPDHVEPYASRDDELPRPVPAMPDHVEPYSSRD